MPDAIDPKLFDKRVAARYLHKGRLDEKVYAKHLDALPDLSSQAVEITSEFLPSAAPRPSGAPGLEPDGLED